MRHPIPSDALDDRLGFIGTSGSGKTYNAGTAIEILLSRRARTVIIDPLGVWWGLRLLADGKKPSNFDVVIFGGDHADLPLNEQAGALIGETAANMSESCIIDLSKLPSRAAERRFMVAFLEKIYRKAGGGPFHLVVDEADLFAPQKPQAGDEVLLGHMENIVRRGRVRGFIPWLISQRPAVLNKNVLSQVDGLLAFKLTASQDRDALDAWIEGQADKDQGKEIKASLPTYQIGEGLVWLPSHGILARKPFPAKVTFDSSRKPKRGEKLANRKLKALDVGKLKDRIAAVVEEAKANDPKELRKQVADLTAKLNRAESAPADKAEVTNRVDAARIRGKVEGYTEAMKEVGSIFRDLAPTMAKLKPLVDAIEQNGKKIEGWAAHIGERRAELAQHVPDLAAPTVVIQAGAFRPPPPKRPAPRPPSSPNGNGDARISGVQQTILNAIAEMEGLCRKPPPRTLVAMMANYKNVKSTGFAKALSNLSASGLVVYPDSGSVSLTDGGLGLASPPAAALTTAEVQSRVIEIMGDTAGRILTNLITAYPSDVDREALAQCSGYHNVKSTGFAKALSRLSALGFVNYPSSRSARAGELLFP